MMLACCESFEKVALASMFISDSALCEAGENFGRLRLSFSMIPSKIRASVARSLRAYLAVIF